MNKIINCPKCGEVMGHWRFIGVGEDQVWEKVNDYYCQECCTVLSPEPVVESDTKGDLNTDGFIM